MPPGVDELAERRKRKAGAEFDPRPFRDVADSISTSIQTVRASVDALRRAVIRLAEATDDSSVRLSKADLQRLHPLLEGMIEQFGGLLVGAGFVAEPDFLADAAHWLEWRMANDDGFSTMEVTLDANEIADYNYVESEWFAAPKRGVETSVVGPYVDFGGTNAYVVTLTIPVRSGERFMGVVGADLSVDRVEAMLRRLTRTVGLAAMVVTHEGRVIASSVPRQYPGTLLRGLPAVLERAARGEQRVHIFDCGDLPWHLVVLGCADPRNCDDADCDCADL